MCSRLSLFALRAIGANLNINLSRNVQITCISKTFAHKYSTTIVSRPGYIMSDIKTAPHTNICQKYSSDANQSTVPVVTYEEVKDLPNHPEKFLIDVREPNELQETGIIPTAINIPLGEVNAALNLSEQKFKSIYKRNKPNYSDEIIFHCRIGRRSESAANTAIQCGYKNTKNYVGSWLDWAKREGLPSGN